jgi:hypothetical protein
VINAQMDQIKIDAQLDFAKKEIQIIQQITCYNLTGETLDTIYLHNWPNSYKDRNTPLSRRLIEDYDKSLYFAKKERRGHTTIKSISTDFVSDKWEIDKESPDIIRVLLTNPIKANDSVTVSLTYVVKVPDSRYTGYGTKNNTYNLRYWYITPATYTNKWELMSNLNMDDLYMHPANYTINFEVPRGVLLNSDLEFSKTDSSFNTIYHLSGEQRVDIELNISLLNEFETFKTDSLNVISNVNGTLLDHNLKTDIIKREILFINKYLGSYPHKSILVNNVTYEKNPIYGLNQLPKFLNPFSGAFEWDIKMFKALTRKYLENTLLVNRRTDSWILDGIQTYLMIKYVEEYYPEVKAMGNISNIWGIKSSAMAKLDFNDKYPFVYQFAARQNLDQALATRADSLSNFNRKIVNKYKAGLGLRYLDEYLNDSIVTKSIKQFYIENTNQLCSSNTFKDIIIHKTDKDLSWFFGNYIHSKKKIDYTIRKIKKTNDSVYLTIKNKRNFTAPIALYAVNNKDIIFRKWLTGIDSTATIAIPKGDYKRLSLNYEYLYPELNLRDNWKNLKGLFNKPIQFRFFKDVEDPYYNQVFYNLYTDYNLYDGLVIGPRIYNESIFKKKWLYKITPLYGTNSKKLIGSFSLVYQHLPEESSVYRYTAGIAGSNFHYAPELQYKTLVPFVNVQFKRNSLRDVGGKSILARYVVVDKDIAPDAETIDYNKYNVFNIRYGYAKPEIIDDLRYYFDFQLGDKFSKLSADFRYRKLTDKYRQYDFRAYFGTFLSNKTQDDYFSFSLDRPKDYLFDYDYLGRSEQSGFFSQQIIIAEGGFKSMFENPYANQWIATTNGSFSVWKWIEIYADAGFYKNKGFDPSFKYDSGVRLNFIHNILEVYFPIQSSLGFEPSNKAYPTKIRFVLTVNPNKIVSFLRRGFF